jgi:hypothetical protein
MTLLDRLMANLAPPNARGCRLWQLSTKNGYGHMSVDGEMVYTHRLLYELLVGTIPPGLQVLHSCDVKPCNTLEHFFLGTQLDNLADMRAKGRGAAPPPGVAGEGHHLVTLADVDVATIRRRYLAGRGQRELAREYGCSQSTIHRYVFDVVRRAATAYPDPNAIWLPPQQLSLLESA